MSALGRRDLQLIAVSSTGSPTLTIDSTSSAGTRQAWLKLNVNNSGSSDPAGAINFSAADIEQARIDSITSISGTTDGILRFFTRKSGTVTEQVRIDNNGNVGIGTTSPSQLSLSPGIASRETRDFAEEERKKMENANMTKSPSKISNPAMKSPPWTKKLE